MNLITELYEPNRHSHHPELQYYIRKAARAIVLNELGEIALLHVSVDGYYKLPGGGMEAGESIEDALIREVLEEVGVSIDIQEEVGMIVEYRDRANFLQISYCYMAHVKGARKLPAFTETEQEEGFRLGWYKLEDALKLLQSHKPDNYVGSFIVARDLAFVEAALQTIRFK